MDTTQFVEVQGTEIIKFETIGQKLEGQLIGTETARLKDDRGKLKEVTGYVVRKESGATVKFLPPYDLADKLRQIPRGSVISIEYKGNDVTREVKQGQSAMKLFTVLRGPVQSLIGSDLITDDDIPF